MAQTNAPLRRPGDPSEMTRAIDELQAFGTRLRRPSQYQLKVGRLNFYPGTGTINFDNERPRPERGLAAAILLIEDAAETALAPLQTARA